MGEVYLAVDPLLQRQVAVKLLPPDTAGPQDSQQRLLRVARAAAVL